MARAKVDTLVIPKKPKPTPKDYVRYPDYRILTIEEFIQEMRGGTVVEPEQADDDEVI